MTARLVHTHAALVEARTPGQPIAVVMTMGALHEGHAELVREARSVVGSHGSVIVTDFVNPLQFGAGEDYDRYPRTLEADVELASQAGADIVFAPDVAEVYGSGDPRRGRVTISAGPLGNILEGAARPGHFDGMLTVVGTLLHLTAPQFALFGEKDYQQLVLIRQMVDHLRFPVVVLPVATVREPDGLAMSSRNRYLSPDERAAAAAVPRALIAATIDAELQGRTSAITAGLEVLAAEPLIEVDYLEITDPMLGPITEGEGRALIAVRIGGTRLIDNMACTVKGER
jgi:pantoate--beta-alanine ligase